MVLFGLQEVCGPARRGMPVWVLSVILIFALVSPVGLVAADEHDSGTGWDSTADHGDDVDALIEDVMDDHDVAGASVAVVEGDDIVHLEGYGMADADSGEPVDPNETAFMIGSVSKLFVWSAVAQGVEDGDLEIDEPIDTYLEDYSFEGDEEVTLEELGTHSAGYEDRFEGLFVEEPADDWERTLESEMPTQVREPEEAIAYSNHGTALAGLVVQEAVDDPFGEHVEESLFDPLEMNQSTFDQPVPEDRQLSNGHVPVGDDFETDDPVIVGVPPAGSMTATAEDMGNFSVAMLEEGEFEDERILEAESVEMLTTQRTSNHPEVGGVGYGYMTTDYRGEELVWHTGGTEYFHTVLGIFPEHDVAFFASFNTPTGAHNAALAEFADQRFDLETDEREPDPETTQRADAYEGEYRSTSIQTTHESLLGLAESWTVSVEDDGTLELATPFGGSSQWVEREPGVFEPASPEDAQLGITTLAIDDETLYFDAPLAPAERLSWYETTTAQATLAAGSLLALFSTLLVWPATAYRTRGWGRLREHVTRPRLAVLTAIGLLALFLVGIVVNTLLDPNQFIYGYSLTLTLTLALLVPFAVVSIGAVGLIGREWRTVLRNRNTAASSTNRYGLAYLTLLAVALVAVVWQLWYWNLLTAAF